VRSKRKQGIERILRRAHALTPRIMCHGIKGVQGIEWDF
jgi:hypothetical protein